MEGKRFLIVGSNVRNVAESARKAGFRVYCLTKHADADLHLYAEKIFRIDDESHEAVRKKAMEISETYNAEIICHSGYEDLLDRKIERVVNKRKFYRELEKIGVDFPEILSNGEYGVLKPERGGGGEEIEFSDREKKGFILQRYIDGIPCSVSVLSSGKRAKAIAANLMLVGMEEFNASGFRYCGNITPFITEHEKEMKAIAEELSLYFELEGNVGVDFILAEKPYVLEINPRFQGSLDSIEWAYGINLFRAHLDAMNNRFQPCKAQRFAGRAVVFAVRDVTIKSSPVGNPFFADIPGKGDKYRKDEPLVSILASGNSYEDVLGKLVERKNLYEVIACR